MKALAILLLASLAACKPTLYMIRHGEKPDDGSVGLSPEGEQRAQCLRTVFGSSSQYNIGYVIAQEYKESGKRKRPYDSVAPVASDLGLEVDTSCDRDDSKCVKKLIKNYDGDGNILLCWQHGQMNNILEALGAEDIENYPEDRYDVIWTVPSPYDEITAETSENCPGLDS
uniref:Phosphoglycerate mutase family protein n=1 Tax=Bionectria ochroleuca TaxID=29856 RepID=A0A8H7N8B8_BIOOC